MTEITSVNNARVKAWVSLQRKKNRDQEGLYLVEGRHMVIEALDAGVAETVITTQDTIYENVECVHVSEAVMKKLALTVTPQPVMAVCRRMDNTMSWQEERYLLLDGVQDPGNLGTLLRTGLSFGFNHIILSGNCVDVYNDKVLRSTQGAVFRVHLVRMALNEAITQLKANGVRIIGTALEGASDIRTVSTQGPLAVVMGNEGQGVSGKVLDVCDDLAYIPIQNMESLNVAVAAGIAMYVFSGKEG